MLIRRALMTATALVVPTTALAATNGLFNDDADPADGPSGLDAFGAIGAVGLGEPSPGTTSAADEVGSTTLVVERRHTVDETPGLPERRIEASSAPTITLAPESSPTTGPPTTVVPATSAPATTSLPTTSATIPTSTAASPSAPSIATPGFAADTGDALVTPTVPGTCVDIAVHPGRSSTESPTPAPANHYEARGFEALDRITYRWDLYLSDWEIKFSPGREGVYGYTYTDRRVIEVFVRDGQTIDLLAHVIAHELGHAVDVSLNNSDERRRWQEVRGIEDAPWWPNSGASDFSTGAGDFAESFAAWQIGNANFRSRLSGAPDAGDISLLELLSLG